MPPTAAQYAALCAPAGRQPDELVVRTPPRGAREADITLRVPADAEPGDYPVQATLELTGDIPAAWRQSVEDVCVVSIGEAESELVRLVAEPTDIVVAPAKPPG